MSVMTRQRDGHPEIRGLIPFASLTSLLLNRLVNVPNRISHAAASYASRTLSLGTPVM
jgi:hypothetical protein